jgi:hypothetical protein
MNIQYGRIIKEENYTDGKVDKSVNRVQVRDKVATDSEELAMFIRFQKESKESPDATFVRERRQSKGGNVNRYVVREWIV